MLTPSSATTCETRSRPSRFRAASASSFFSGLVEAWIRKPTYADFLELRNDVQSLRGWYRNRVARVLVNFMLTCIGTAIGVWIAGARILGKLLG